MSRTTSASLLAAVLGAVLLPPAAVDNLASIIVTQRLARADVFLSPAPHVPRDAATQSSNRRPGWLLASRMGSVLVAWDALLSGDSSGAAAALVEAAQVGSGYGKSLDSFVRAGSRGGPGPTGLAEYEYGLALSAIQKQDWPAALQLLERASGQRPGPWPEQFAHAYYSALERIKPSIAAQIAMEQSMGRTPVPRINVGRKEAPGWQVPVGVGDSSLLGFTVHSWTALERGLPVTVDLFWKDVSGRTITQTVQTWNMAPNGGFELDATRPDDFGWFETNPSGESVVPARRDAQHDGRTIHMLVSPSSGPETSSDIVTSLLPVRPDARLLWHAWVEQSDGGNPNMFVTWYNRRGTRLHDDLPLQGSVSRPGRSYAGVLSVPQNATYASVRLSNWKAVEEIRWADFLLIDLRSPAAARTAGPGRP